MKTHWDMDLLSDYMPPEVELLNLVEQAFHAGQTDRVQADLAYTYLRLEAHNHDRIETH